MVLYDIKLGEARWWLLIHFISLYNSPVNVKIFQIFKFALKKLGSFYDLKASCEYTLSCLS